MIYKETIALQSHGGTPSFLNITEEVKKAIANSGVKEGICVVISPHTTCSVFFEEFVHDLEENGDEYLQTDLNTVLTKMIPDNVAEGQYRYPGEKHYEAVASWPDAEAYLPGGDRTALLNCDAHLKATMLGSSQVFDVASGKLGVGTTGYIYFVDFDRTRPRPRKCVVRIIGE